MVNRDLGLITFTCNGLRQKSSDAGTTPSDGLRKPRAVVALTPEQTPTFAVGALLRFQTNITPRYKSPQFTESVKVCLNLLSMLYGINRTMILQS